MPLPAEGSDEMRARARAIFLHALAECTIQKAFSQHLEFSRGVLRLGTDLYHLTAFPRVLVISMGKAAQPMAQVLAENVGGQLEGIVVCPQAQVHLPGMRYFFGGHPVPNAESVKAAEGILRTLAGAQNALVLYLISGGASSMVEKPLERDITLDDLVATYRALVLSGAPIAEINAIRKHLSAIKGGRLTAAAPSAQHVSVMISDVPDHSLDSLASGPTMPDPSTSDDCYRIAEKYSLLPQFPASVRSIFAEKELVETPKTDDEAFRHSRWWPVLTNATAQKAAAAKATEEGFAVEIDNSCDDWDYARAADHLLQRVRELRQGVSKVALISGGEVTVKVPDACGRGGRNQHFALYCAEKMAGEKLCVLSGGTDGIDGNSTAAGAVVDGGSIERAKAAGLDPQAALARFDAFPVFEKLGDSLQTGPTGTNVRDLRILLAY